MQSLGSYSESNGDVASNHVTPEEVLSDDDDVVEEVVEQTQSRAGVFSKFRSVCQNVFQSLIGGKQTQQLTSNKSNENATRIIRRRSRQTLVPSAMQRKASELSVLNHMETSSNLASSQSVSAPVNSFSTSHSNNNTKPSVNLHVAAASNAMDVGNRLAQPTKRGFTDIPDIPSSTPFRGDVSNHTFAAPWSSLKQRRLDESSAKPAEVATFVPPMATSVRAAPVIETTSIHQTFLENDRYSSMTLPSSNIHRPISRNSRDCGSALSGETSTLATPLGAKRRISLFETKTMTPHFKAEKMDAVPYGTLDRIPARSSPLVGLASPKPLSPLAPRVVRLDLTNSRASPAASPLVRAPLMTMPSVANPTAQRLAKAYQQLTSASTTKPQIAPIDPSRVHLIDPAQYFSRPKTEALTTKPEPISIRSVDIEKPVAVEQNSKPAFRFASPAASIHEPIVTGKLNGNATSSSKFLLTAPSVLVDSNTGAGTIWTCSDCDIANSDSNDYCFSCGRSKVSSSKVEPFQTSDQPDVAIKRQRQSIQAPSYSDQFQPMKSSITASVPPETSNRIMCPSATSTPFVMSAGFSKKSEESNATVFTSKPSVPPASAVNTGLVGQWRCSNCLFMNDFKTVSCTRCSRSSSSSSAVSNGTLNAAELSSSTPAAGASSRLKRRATMEGGWLCGCQHMNPRSANVCDLCSAPKPQASSGSVAPLDSATSKETKEAVNAQTSDILPGIKPFSNGPSSDSAKMNLPSVSLGSSAEAVKLTTATATTISITAPIPTPAPVTGAEAKPESSSVASTLTTSTLTAPKPSTGFGAMFAAKEGEWTCDTCMVRNKKEDTKCAACETPNPSAPKAAASEAPKFGFGSAPAPAGGFAFGVSKPAETTVAASTSSVSFGVPAPISSSSAPATTASSAIGGFKFGATLSPSSNSSASTTAASSGFAFGAPIATSAPATSMPTTAPAFTFGSLAGKPSTSTSVASNAGGFAFTFGNTTAASTAPVAVAPSFGNTTAAPTAPTTVAPSFGSATTAFGTSGSSSTPSSSSAAPSVFGLPVTTSASSLFPTTTTSSSSAVSPFNFGASQNSGTLLFGSTVGTTVATTSSTTAPLFAFGASSASTPVSTIATTASNSGGFGFGSTSTSSAPSSGGFTFGSAAAASAPVSTAPFGFGSNATPASTAAPAPFAFGAMSTSTASTTVANPAPFSFGGAPTASTAPQPPAPTGGMFAFGSSASSTGTTNSNAFGAQPPSSNTAPAPFAFGSLASQPAPQSVSTGTGFNFGSSVPAFGSSATAGTNGIAGGFKFDGAAPAFNFSAGNPSSGPTPVAATQQPPSFVFNTSGGFSPAPTTPGGDGGPLLFSSGAAGGSNRPKAAAVRKLKVAGRK